jgi:hypothetical protein
MNSAFGEFLEAEKRACSLEAMRTGVKALETRTSFTARKLV